MIYNNEEVVIDFSLNCSCLSFIPLATTGVFAGTYTLAPTAAADSLVPLWYTEISGGTSAFTGYRIENTAVGGTSFSRLFNASTGALGLPPVLGGR